MRSALLWTLLVLCLLAASFALYEVLGTMVSQMYTTGQVDWAGRYRRIYLLLAAALLGAVASAWALRRHRRARPAPSTD